MMETLGIKPDEAYPDAMIELAADRGGLFKNPHLRANCMAEAVEYLVDAFGMEPEAAEREVTLRVSILEGTVASG